MARMQVDVLMFAGVRDRAGTARVRLELPDGATVCAAVEALAGRFPAIREQLSRVAYALNCCYVQGSAYLKDGDELALIPPVSGG
jgi:molybdopterin synthase catalytic subunit